MRSSAAVVEFSGDAPVVANPYVKLLSRYSGCFLVSNAMVFIHLLRNLPTTPWTKNKQGQGPAWSNSLFEDNAEFGLGMRMTADHQIAMATRLLEELAPELGDSFVNEIITAPQLQESDIASQRKRIDELKQRLAVMPQSSAKHLLSICEQLVHRSVWLIGGDGWATTLVTAMIRVGREKYKHTCIRQEYIAHGRKNSKSTQPCLCEFAAAGKEGIKKTLRYKHVYGTLVADCFCANPHKQCLHEEEKHTGPSLFWHTAIVCAWV